MNQQTQSIERKTKNVLAVLWKKKKEVLFEKEEIFFLIRRKSGLLSMAVAKLAFSIEKTNRQIDVPSDSMIIHNEWYIWYMSEI